MRYMIALVAVLAALHELGGWLAYAIAAVGGLVALAFLAAAQRMSDEASRRVGESLEDLRWLR